MGQTVILARVRLPIGPPARRAGPGDVRSLGQADQLVSWAMNAARFQYGQCDRIWPSATSNIVTEGAHAASGRRQRAAVRGRERAAVRASLHALDGDDTLGLEHVVDVEVGTGERRVERAGNQVRVHARRPRRSDS